MPKLLAVEKWIEQIDAMIERLSTLDCETCLPEWMDRMVQNKIIKEYKIEDTFVQYHIDGHDIVYMLDKDE